MEKLEYEIEFITPAFIGGADPKEYAELRPASFVGLLRYWFRVIVGAYVQKPEELFKLESELFGSQERAGKVFVRVYSEDHDRKKYKFYDNANLKGMERYILGPANRKKCIPKGSKFEIKIITPDNISQLVDTIFRFAITYGNIGYRARKGFGSMDFTDSSLRMSPNAILENAELVVSILKPIADKHRINMEYSGVFNDSIPNISNMVVFSSNTLVFNFYGYEYWQLRRAIYKFWDKKPKLPKTHEYSECIDRLLSNNECPDFKPKHHLFGLPIQFSSKSRSCRKNLPNEKEKTIRAQVQLNWNYKSVSNDKHQGEANRDKDMRRAAPFWISFKKDITYAVLFKAKFLPDDGILVVKPKGKYWKQCKNDEERPRDIVIEDFSRDMTIIEEFFKDRLKMTQVFSLEALK